MYTEHSTRCLDRLAYVSHASAMALDYMTSVIDSPSRTLLRWYRSGEDAEPRLPALSTYLGHTSVSDTYWYLSACPELMELAAKRVDRRWRVVS